MDAARQKSLFLYKAHHELNTPLSKLKTTLPCDLVLMTTNCSAGEAVSLFFARSTSTHTGCSLSGNGNDRLHPPWGRWCLHVFLGPVLCPGTGDKPDTLKIEHFLHKSLNSLSC